MTTKGALLQAGNYADLLIQETQKVNAVLFDRSLRPNLKGTLERKWRLGDQELLACSDFELQIERIRFEEGSIDVRGSIYLTLVILGIAYEGIAMWPDFKDGLQEVQEDLRKMKNSIETINADAKVYVQDQKVLVQEAQVKERLKDQVATVKIGGKVRKGRVIGPPTPSAEEELVADAVNEASDVRSPPTVLQPSLLGVPGDGLPDDIPDISVDLFFQPRPTVERRFIKAYLAANSMDRDDETS